MSSIREKIQILEKTNRLLIDNLIDAVWLVDAETLQYEYITPSIQKISGYTPKELYQTRLVDRLMPDSYEYAMDLLTRGLRRTEAGQWLSHTLELELRHKNGSSYWIEIRAKLTREQSGPLKIVGITRDITLRKRAEKEQADVNQQLRQALAEKENLLREVKLLRELLPICSGCKRIRDENGKWWPLDLYVQNHTNTNFTHTICSDCQSIIYPDE